LQPRPSLSVASDGGVLSYPVHIRLQEEELDAWRFTGPGEFEQYLPPFLVSRVRAALTARFTGIPAYVATEAPVS